MATGRSTEHTRYGTDPRQTEFRILKSNSSNSSQCLLGPSQAGRAAGILEHDKSRLQGDVSPYDLADTRVVLDTSIAVFTSGIERGEVDIVSRDGNSEA
jgi:hypothetical protein